MSLEQRFWRVFNRALGTSLGPGVVRKDDVEQWDSLKHVELIFELEESFDVDVSPDDIADLYSDTDKLIAYIRTNRGEQ